MEQKLQFFRSIIELNNDESNDEEFVKSVTEDVLNNTIYVFTPRGDVIELPKGSTPIDFAYRVHTDVGDKMVGAIVNNVIVPLDHELKDNDIIKINTNKNSFGPSREWINMAKTTGAKNKIKSFYRKIEKEEYLKKGEEALNKELRKRKIIFSDFLTNENMDKIIKELKYTNLLKINKIMHYFFHCTTRQIQFYPFIYNGLRDFAAKLKIQYTPSPIENQSRIFVR